MKELLRAAYVIARRDFAATVFSRAFLLFLLGPLFPFLMVAVISGGRGALDPVQQPVIGVIASQQDYAAMASAHERLQSALAPAELMRIKHFAPEPDLDAQRRRVLASSSPPVIAVLDGGLERARLTGAVGDDGVARRQMQLLLREASLARGGSAVSEPRVEVVRLGQSAGSSSEARANTARVGQGLLFLLTILLAGMLLSQIVEEKSNKVVEVLAAAVPIDAIFLGKLLAMLAMSFVGIAVWGLGIFAAAAAWAPSGLSAIPAPAVGWTAFLVLTLVYFAMSYLLLGSAFLGIGAQASTVREVQTLSMPVTMSQVVIFAVAAVAIGNGNSIGALAAAAFPLSSPYVMVARAAEMPELWPHLVAIVWQLAWVALIIRLASRLFRRNVLKSGPARRRWWRKASA
ncbi:MAG TPA: ABC transporter permease [Sphingomicrobium sp.]|nr:ABC transporter permease [Sphingomicrobium sp.]